MPKRDIVVIGASAGGLAAVQSLLAHLPKDLPAAIFLVIHTSPEAPGLLASILDRVGSLPAVNARNGASVERGTVYVAPPDRHLVLKNGQMELSRGPREHRFRPAIDPLFRSAAENYRDRVIGVVLTGHMADGTHGLLVIKQMGGVAIVQDPREAFAPMMPKNAIEQVDVDYVLPTKEIGSVITGLVMGSHAQRSAANNRRQQREGGQTDTIGVESPRPEKPHADGIQAELANGSPSPLTCPDCGGTLWEFENGELLRYRCHVGHGFTAVTLYNGQREKIEETLWSALRAIEETLELRKRMAERARGRNLYAIVPGLERDIAEYESRADALREMLIETPSRTLSNTGRRKAPARSRRTRTNGKARR